MKPDTRVETELNLEALSAEERKILTFLTMQKLQEQIPQNQDR